MGHALPTVNALEAPRNIGDTSAAHEGYGGAVRPQEAAGREDVVVHQRRIVWPLKTACGLRVGAAAPHHGWSWSARAVTCEYCKAHIPHPEHAHSTFTCTELPPIGNNEPDLSRLCYLPPEHDTTTSRRHDDPLEDVVAGVVAAVSLGSDLMDLFDSSSRTRSDESTPSTPDDFEGRGGKFGGGGATGSWD